jgi:hypothetical protein
LFGAFIIGDEIIVGKRQDKHLSFLDRAPSPSVACAWHGPSIWATSPRG